MEEEQIEIQGEEEEFLNEEEEEEHVCEEEEDQIQPEEEEEFVPPDAEEDLETRLQRKWDEDLVPKLRQHTNYFDQLRVISQHQRWLKDQKTTVAPRDKASLRLIEDHLRELEELQQQYRNEQLEIIDEVRQQTKGGDDGKAVLEREKAELQEHLDNMTRELEHALKTRVNKRKTQRKEPNAFFTPFQIISNQNRWLSKLRLRTSPKRELIDMISEYEDYLREKKREVKPGKPNYEQEARDHEREIAEKERRLEKLQDEVEENKATIESLNQEILETKLRIARTENANKLFQQFKPVTVPEYPPEEIADEEVDFDPAHEEILRGKRDQLQLLRKEVKALEDEKQQLELQLESLAEETDSFQKETVELTEAIRIMNAEGDRMQTQCAYVREQIGERTNEVKILEKLKKEGETAYAQLKDRAQNFDSLDGGRIDIEKTIVNLQSQLQALEEEIRETNTHILAASEENDAFMEEAKARQSQFEGKVDWQRERDDLQRELQELTEEIRERKSRLTQKEHKNDSKQATVTKYGPLLKKWKGRTNGANVPSDKTVHQLWAELGEARTQSEDMVKKAERELGELVLSNAKLEEELQRRKNSLQRVITQAYAEENQFRRSIEDKQMRAEAAESKLLRQIQDAKLKLAQKQLQQLRK